MINTLIVIGLIILILWFFTGFTIYPLIKPHLGIKQYYFRYYSIIDSRWKDFPLFTKQL
jgi:hypothetical protein